MSILQDVGLSHKRVVSQILFGGRKVQVAWWSHSDKYITEILADTSDDGRAKLKKAFKVNPFIQD